MRSHLHNVGGWTARWADRAPDRLALADGPGAERRLSYAALEARVAHTAGWLEARGVLAGERVGLLLANRAEVLELVLATARIGAISVPMNTRLAAGEIAFQVDDCRPRLLCIEADLAQRVDAALSHAVHAPGADGRVVLDRDSQSFAREIEAAEPASPVAIDPEDPMMLMYTSGTTGAPKGALLPHRKTLYNALNAQLFFGIRPGADRVLVAAPLFHSLGLKILSLPVLYAGGSLVLHSRFDPADFWETVEREAITYSGGVPTQYRMLLDALTESPPRDLSSLRFLFTAGAAISSETVHAFERHGLVLKQGYGQTETSILCCLDESEAIRKAGSVGRPVFHADLRVVDPEHCALAPEHWRDVAAGDSGEIVVRGPITMLGYWERPEETAQTLRGEWLRTGDLARVDAEGFVTLAGRARDMYISGGENVYPAEVEAVLGAHPDIREVAVVGVPDADWGETGHAHVVFEPGRSLGLDALRDWARDRLAAFKLPSALIVEQRLPRTASGKLEKYRLGSR